MTQIYHTPKSKENGRAFNFFNQTFIGEGLIYYENVINEVQNFKLNVY